MLSKHLKRVFSQTYVCLYKNYKMYDGKIYLASPVSRFTFGILVYISSHVVQVLTIHVHNFLICLQDIIEMDWLTV